MGTLSGLKRHGTDGVQDDLQDWNLALDSLSDRAPADVGLDVRLEDVHLSLTSRLWSTPPVSLSISFLRRVPTGTELVVVDGHFKPK